VTGLTGRLAQVVDYVNTAWEDIQTERGDWRWMRTRFTGSILSAATAWSYTDFSITSFSHWVFDPRPSADSGFSLYLTATGVSDEQPLRYMEWDLFHRRYLRGSQTDSRPQWFTVNDSEQIVLGPGPDADYTIRGMYQKGPTTLSANDDTPAMPSQFHRLIVWHALVMMAENDEAVAQDPAWRLRRDAMRAQLVRHQIDPIRLTGSHLA
jgi:hypothetical protein